MAECARARDSREPSTWTQVGEHFARALEAGEGDPPLHAGQALCLLRLGQAEEAKRFYESVAEKRADLPPSLAAAVARFPPGHEAVGVRPATREPIAALALAADGEVAAVGSTGGEIRILELGPGSVLFNIEGEVPRVRDLAITPDGQVAYTTTYERADLYRWRFAEWPKFEAEHLGRIDPRGRAVFSNNLSQASNGERLVVAGTVEPGCLSQVWLCRFKPARTNSV